ncbi:hypothetical protein N7478_007506 [Penicillium angulare]|uniref:uncharacterized protein n=1 Tax=Penicillium angulare TaxID=116970 RepID=UPI00253F7A6E|nr:uncharacterized protein N7478_007506 [Penicillium angulare]KAJ5272381.1 hypothetical protein N7478_007506 [Penicillium angulare]
METHTATFVTQPASRKPSRYRSTREGSRAATDLGCGAAMTNTNTRPGRSQSSACSSEPNPNANPSIARSMSRYRRNRPPTASNGNTRTGKNAVSDQARAQPVLAPPMPRIVSTAQEETLREKHRLDAMEQLTGGSGLSKFSAVTKIPNGSSFSSQPAPSPSEESSSPMKSLRGHRPRSNPSVNTGERKSFLQKVKLSRTKESSAKEQPVPRYIGVGGGGIVPGTDAPISAVNAGERYVLLQYSDVTLYMPITPSTLVSDLLLSASEQLHSDIDPEKFILIESFHQVGLQRPLRRYEHVRDVMNSWAHDGDNRLIIIPPSSIDALDQVDAQKVPSEKPAETTVYLYHSQRPRKWDKRYVTLRPDGQIVISKKENSKDHTSICHLSDFDIYSPNPRAMTKEIKPPKKICFAIKSQEKSSMFLSTENFVHFFSTSDRNNADKWYNIVQQWRSWYLVHTLGALQSFESESPHTKHYPTENGSQGISTDSHLLNRIPGPTDPGSRMRPSMDQTRSSALKDAFSRKQSTREHRPPPSRQFPELRAINTHTSDTSDDGPLVKGITPEEIEEETFSPTGLLGRSYTQRHRAMRERQENEKRANQDPFNPEGLLNEEQIQSPTIAPPTSTLITRTKSIKQSNKPLIDLTPVFKEAPQHIRKGRGVTVDSGMPLIEAATGPELTPSCMSIPPAATWRRPPAPAPAQAQVTDIPPVPQIRTRANTIRSVRHASQPRPGTSSAGASPSSPAVPFLPNSLLASNGYASTGAGVPIGHGVATGDRNATRPMLDMSPQSPFAEGSLLHQL